MFDILCAKNAGVPLIPGSAPSFPDRVLIVSAEALMAMQFFVWWASSHEVQKATVTHADRCCVGHLLIIPSAFFYRRKPSNREADPAVVPIIHEVPPYQRLPFTHCHLLHIIPSI